MKSNQTGKLKAIKEKLLHFYYCEIKTFNKIVGIR